MLSEKTFNNAVCVIVLGMFVALIVGYDKTVGYNLSLSRTLVFFPFFALGYYYSCIQEKYGSLKYVMNCCIIILTAIFLGGMFFVIKGSVLNQLLYGSYSYLACNQSIFDRCIVMGTAFASIFLLNVMFSNAKLLEKRIPYITVLGQNTMMIYLFHAFWVKFAGKYDVFHYNLAVNTSMAIAFSVIVIWESCNV